jgi:uncharacterized integral membrane protein
MDSMIALLANQFGSIVAKGSYWIVGIYLLLYLAGGLFIALLAYRTIKSFKTENPAFILHVNTEPGIDQAGLQKTVKKNNFKKLWVLIMLMLGVSVVLFVFADDNKTGWLAVVKTISWTLSAILIWFMLIGPLFTKAIQKILQKKESRYSDEVLKTLSFLPVLRRITALAWQQSSVYRGLKRWPVFLGTLIHATLTYSEQPAIPNPNP